MKDDRGDKAFLDDLKQQLDRGAEEIDELTLARLGAARRRAVEAGSHRHSAWQLGDILIAGRWGRIVWLAGGLLLLALLMLRPPLSSPASQPLHLLDDMELLGSSEELEFYQELDFFLWVADEQGES
ncbi:MAG: hypothetical protein P8166_05755 [Candidatus Thiodiazotropha sp.]|jgi:hypothetical protein